MLVEISKIVVGDRIREDFGDIKELADDIKRNGLINPPTINKEYRLLAGERRLRACKSLGWTQIEVHMLDTRDAAHDLDVEMSENNMRRNFTGSELAKGIRRQMAIESERARERMAEGGRGGNVSTPSSKARDKAGEAFGISGKQAEKVVFVDEHRDMLDPADFAEWDEGKLSTNKAYQRIKAAQKQAERERDEARKELSEAHGRNMELGNQIVALERQVAERPEPEVIEREVVREVESQESKRRIAELERENKRLNDEYQQMWAKKRDADQRLQQANERLGENDRNNNARRDIEQLTIATNSYLRNYGGKAWAFDQFDRVDETTQQEFTKAITSLAAFAQNMAAMIQDREQLGA